MKRRTKNQGKLRMRSVPLPPDLDLAVSQRIANDPEMDFSQYMRRLIRKDLQRQAA